MAVFNTPVNKSRLWSLIPSGAFAGAMTMPSPVQQINACSQPKACDQGMAAGHDGHISILTESIAHLAHSLSA